MPLYHVYISFNCVFISNVRPHHFQYNLDEETVKRNIAIPFMKNEPFLFGGRRVTPDSIHRILIFRSDECIDVESIRRSPYGAVSDAHIAESFLQYGHKGITDVTYRLITSVPKAMTVVDRAGSGYARYVKEALLRDKVFIVHGRDHEQALLLQKFLRGKNIDALIFDDLPDQGRTIIEQLEFIKDYVFYVFAIMTPDDLGCLREEIEDYKNTQYKNRTSIEGVASDIFGMLRTRVRQNVVFEMGFFIGTLGRENICCLAKTDTKERPSDIEGILYKPFSISVKEVFHEIDAELTKMKNNVINEAME